MTDLDWIAPASYELHFLLNPESTMAMQEVAELRGAGVAEHTVNTLYPMEHLDHVEAVRALVPNEEFISLAADSIAGLDSLRWALLTPLPLGVTLICWHDARRNSYSLTNRSGVRTLDIEIKRELFGGAKFERQSEVTKQLLTLPAALHLFQSYPFEGHFWEESDIHSQFLQESALMQPKIEQLLALLRAYH